MQEIADELELTIIRVFGIHEHEKGEVNHVGGIAKSTIKGRLLLESFLYMNDMVTFCRSKFGDKVCLSYYIKQIGESDLLEMRELNKLNAFNSLDGSSKFQVV